MTNRVLLKGILSLAAGGCTAPVECATADPWEALGTVSVDSDGISMPLNIRLNGAHGALTIRALPQQTADDSAASCISVYELVDSAGNAWVSPQADATDNGIVCTDCEQKVFSGLGAGLFLFPNNGEPLPDVETIDIRFTVRDCITGLPWGMLPDDSPVESLTVAIRYQPDLQDAEPAHIAVSFVITADTPLVNDHESLQDALNQIDASLKNAGLQTKLNRIHRAEVDAARLSYGRHDHSALFALAPVWEGCPIADEVSIFLVNCLEELDPATEQVSFPNGFTPRIPGGLARKGLVGEGLVGEGLVGEDLADGLFIAVGGCLEGEPGLASVEGLAQLITHELGHYLGLHHTDSGAGTDHLSETQNGPNPMDTHPLASMETIFTESQMRVMRTHPSVEAIAPSTQTSH